MTASPEKSIFLNALELPPGDGRRAYLDNACRGDPALRAGVEALLAAHGRLGGPPPAAGGETAAHDPGASPAGTTVFVPPPAPEAGSVVAGRYKLLEAIGEGGMGTVFLAEQTEPVRRKVALKVVKAGMDSRQVLARFEAERQALALMDHPNIAKVLDAGATADGRPFFAMELVKGAPITRYCDDHKLTPRQRLELFVQVCGAVQHAHQKGVIHRDLKPTNVLVAPYDGRPVPKVIDFGIAKAAGQPLTERTLFTGFGAVVGTPEYMSPEQAALNNQDVDTRSDVYSLGVLLYELLTGTTPLTRKRVKDAALLEVLRLVREEEPPRPSTRLSTADGLPSIAATRGLEPRQLTGAVRGELDWIVMKALEKDRDRRYDTPTGLAADLGRYLADEPVLACPPSAGYRLRKLARRNRGPLAVAAAVLAAVVLGGAAAAWQAVEATAARRQAEAEAANARAAAELAGRREAEAKAAEAKAAEREAQERQARESAEAVAEFMRVVFAGEGTRGEAGRDREFLKQRTVREAMDQAARTIGGKFGDRPEVEAAVRSTIGETYQQLGAYDEAKPQLERALELREKALGPDHPDTLASVNNLAYLLLAKRDYAAAEPLLRRALAGREKALGPDHPDTLTSVHNLARLLQEKWDQAAAEPLYKRALAGREKALGPDHPDTLASVNGLATLLVDKGVLFGKGNPADAEPLYRRALEGYEKTLGPDHPSTLNSVNNLALRLLAKGDLAAAEPLFKRALAGREKALGPDHPDTLMSVTTSAHLLLAKGDWAAAEPLFKRALAGKEKALGPDHPHTLRSVNDLADLYMGLRRYADAVPLLRRAVEGYAKRPEMGVTFIRAGLGLALLGDGKLAEAEPHLLAGYRGLSKLKFLNASYRNRLRAVTEGLVDVYERTGRPEKAKEWRAKLAKLPSELAPPPRPVK